MVAGVLHRSGWNTGDNYLEARRPTNPTGFFEDRTVNRVNDRILQSADPSRWVRTVTRLGLSPLRRGLWVQTVDRTIRMRRADARTVRQLTTHAPFAYKDPRFCHTLPQWEPHLPDGTAKVVVFREPGRTVNSIRREAENRKRFAMTVSQAVDYWTRSYRNVLGWADQSWLFVHFDQMLDGTAFARMEHHLDGKVDRTHVNPKLRRSPDMPDIGAEAASVYQELMGRT